jgi:hypothetical protein
VRKSSTAAQIDSGLKGTAAGTLYRSLNLLSSNGFIPAASSSVSRAPAISALIAARCGALFCGYMAAAAGKAAPELAERCCACAQPARDSLSHITASCGAYAKERADHLLPLWERCLSVIDHAAGGHHGAAPTSVEDLSADELTALAVGSSGDAACVRLWLGPQGKQDTGHGTGVVAADADMPVAAGAASPGSSASSVSDPASTEHGFWAAARFYAAVLPAHRRRVASACDAFLHLRADGPAPVDAPAAQVAPNGANAAFAVGPPAVADAAPP